MAHGLLRAIRDKTVMDMSGLNQRIMSRVYQKLKSRKSSHH